MTTDAVVYCDGACEPKNPGGIASYGWVAYWKGQKRAEDCGVICEGNGATNNVAEYGALINALNFFVSKGFKGPLTVRTDSQLVVNQLSGAWSTTPGKPYFPYYQQAAKLAIGFDSIVFEWIPREKNEAADCLSKQAYRDYRQGKRI